MGVRAGFGPPAPAVPGEVARCDLTVENTGGSTEEARLELQGEAATWGWITLATLSLGPGETAGARVTLKVPRAPNPPAGPLPVVVRVTAAGEQRDVGTTVDVAPFVDLQAVFDAGRRVLCVENRGNSAASAAVEGHGDGVSVRVERDRIDLGPGATAEVPVTASAGRRGGTFSLVVRPDGPGTPARAGGSLEPAPAGSGGRLARGALAVLAVALVAVGLRATVSSSGSDPPESATPATPLSTECPGHEHLSPDANGVVRPGVRPAFDYTFLFVGPDGCKPARFNPCAPVRYTLNRRQATDAHVADLEEALRKTSAATGLEFEYAGPSTDNAAVAPRPVRRADGTFDWPPVLIGWEHLGTGEMFRTPEAVRTAPDVVVGGGGRPLVAENVIVTGHLVLNLDAVTDTDTRRPVPHGFGTGVNWGRIILHELAHVIGLGHVESRTSIMNEALTQQTISSANWGVGDLIGLRHLGREAGCLAVPPLQVRGAP